MIYVTGCSFTYGYELPNPEQERWSTVLGRKLNAEVLNEAIPGQSNTNIVKQCLNTEHKPELAIIQFTTYLRPNFKGTLQKYYNDVCTLQTYYKQNNIRYIFMNGFDTQQQNLYDKRIDASNFIGYPDKGMTEFAYGTKNMPKGHPGKEGHQNVAEKLYEFIQNREQITNRIIKCI